MTNDVMHGLDVTLSSCNFRLLHHQRRAWPLYSRQIEVHNQQRGIFLGGKIELFQIPSRRKRVKNYPKQPRTFVFVKYFYKIEKKQSCTFWLLSDDIKTLKFPNFLIFHSASNDLKSSHFHQSQKVEPAQPHSSIDSHYSILPKPKQNASNTLGRKDSMRSCISCSSLARSSFFPCLYISIVSCCCLDIFRSIVMHFSSGSESPDSACTRYRGHKARKSSNRKG